MQAPTGRLRNRQSASQAKDQGAALAGAWPDNRSVPAVLKGLARSDEATSAFFTSIAVRRSSKKNGTNVTFFWPLGVEMTKSAVHDPRYKGIGTAATVLCRMIPKSIAEMLSTRANGCPTEML